MTIIELNKEDKPLTNYSYLIEDAITGTYWKVHADNERDALDIWATEIDKEEDHNYFYVGEEIPRLYMSCPRLHRKVIDNGHWINENVFMTSVQCSRIYITKEEENNENRKNDIHRHR